MTQYTLREADIAVMEWREFSVLLAGILQDTPLGNIVRIRAEEDKDVLKNFSKEEHSIRNLWRSRHSAIEGMTDEEKKEKVEELKNIFAKSFS
jgi:Bacteriophage Gp15 protein.